MCTLMNATIILALLVMFMNNKYLGRQWLPVDLPIALEQVRCHPYLMQFYQFVRSLRLLLNPLWIILSFTRLVFREACDTYKLPPVEHVSHLPYLPAQPLFSPFILALTVSFWSTITFLYPDADLRWVNKFQGANQFWLLLSSSVQISAT